MMRFRGAVLAASALALSLLPAARAAAQSAQRWSVQVSGLYVGLSGDSYDGLENGMGAEAQVRYNPSAFSLGLGYQASSHKFSESSPGLDDVKLRGPFVEPRYVFDIHSDKVAPYVAGRVAYLEQSVALTYDGEHLDLTAKGTQINAGGGLLARLSPRVNLDLGVTYGQIHFDDVKTTYQSTEITIDGTSGSGKNLVFRVGIAIGLGK